MLDSNQIHESVPWIDLRSDVLAPPTEAMWEAMRRADLGWSMVGEDRSVRELEALGAEIVGMEAAVFTPTCSIANLLALMTLGERGTQVVLEATSHIACLEHWNVVYICGLFPQLIKSANGALDPDALREVFRDTEFYGLPGTSLVCLENSHNNAGGAVLTPAQTVAAAEAAHRHGAAVHVDGARIFNSAAALGIPAKALTEGVSTVSLSLNKGLSAPFGALLCGSQKHIKTAKEHLKRLGAASMHKDGLLAAAGIVALTTMMDRIGEDNRHATLLAQGLAEIPGLRVNPCATQTNIVLAETRPSGLTASEFVTRLKEHYVLAKERSADYRVRFVTHRLIGEAEVERVAQAARAVLDSTTAI